MTQLRIPAPVLRGYAAVAVAFAAILSPLALSVVPVALLIWYLFQWRRKMPAAVGLMSESLVFFSIALLFARSTGTVLSPLIALPVLPLIMQKLEETAATISRHDIRPTSERRRLTGMALKLVLTSVVILGMGLLVGNFSLVLAGAMFASGMFALGVISWRGLAQPPVVEVKSTRRVVAGSRATFAIDLSIARAGGRIFIEPESDWVRVEPAVLSLKGESVSVSATVSPTLSGPTAVRLKATCVDRWGLVQSQFTLEPAQIFVIPRAKYAAWLVDRYIAGSHAGSLPLVASVGLTKPQQGLRRGIEYYGSQLYQPGDSLKNIDWKHSLRHNELISKEFAEFRGTPAVVLVNLVASDAEGADELAYNLLTAALSLARENIPAALAAYDQDEVKLVTSPLPGTQLLLASLQLSKQIAIEQSPIRYLSPPDVARLRSNIGRLGTVESPAATKLTGLLRFEFDNVRQASRRSPATEALENVLAGADRNSGVIMISQGNHDAEALAFNTFTLRQRGNHVMALNDLSGHPVVGSKSVLRLEMRSDLTSGSPPLIMPPIPTERARSCKCRSLRTAL